MVRSTRATFACCGKHRVSLLFVRVQSIFKMLPPVYATSLKVTCSVGGRCRCWGSCCRLRHSLHVWCLHESAQTILASEGLVLVRNWTPLLVDNPRYDFISRVPPILHSWYNTCSVPFITWPIARVHVILGVGRSRMVSVFRSCLLRTTSSIIHHPPYAAAAAMTVESRFLSGCRFGPASLVL